MTTLVYDVRSHTKKPKTSSCGSFFGVPHGKSSGSLAWSINMADIDLGSKTEPSK